MDEKDQEKEPISQQLAEQLADMELGGIVSASHIVNTYRNPHRITQQVDDNEILLGLKRKSDRVINGETKDIESLLISQATALDAIFTKLSMRAYNNFGQYMNAGEKYLRLALKAQSQCRATLESLPEIKNPRPYIQNNQAEYQQVNNGTLRNSDTDTRPHAHAEKSFSPNELLEDKTHEQEWLDTRTPRETIRSN